LRWIGLGDIGFRYLRIRHALPKSLKLKFDRLLPRLIPLKEQLAEIEILGRGIGLDAREIHAAATLLADNEQPAKRWLTPLTVFVMIVVIIILSFVILIITGIYTNPPTIYGAGLRYGSIKPKDFVSY